MRHNNRPKTGGLPNIYSIVFENLGNNMFIASDSLSGEYIPANTIADFNGDGKKDIIIQGHVDFTNIYWNETLSTSVMGYPEMTFSVFPNPSSGQLQIDWARNTEPVSISDPSSQCCSYLWGINNFKISFKCVFTSRSIGYGYGCGGPSH